MPCSGSAVVRGFRPHVSPWTRVWWSLQSSGPCLQKNEMQSILAIPVLQGTQGSRGRRPRDSHVKGALSVALSTPAAATDAPAVMVSPYWQPRSSWWVLGPTTSGQQSSDSMLQLFPGGEDKPPPHSSCTPQEAGTHPLSQGFRLEARITKSWGLVLPLRAGLMTW